MDRPPARTNDCCLRAEYWSSQPSSVSTITSLPPLRRRPLSFFFNSYFPRCRRRLVLHSVVLAARWARFRENVRDVSVSRPAYPLPNKNNPTHLAASREQRRKSNLNWTHTHAQTFAQDFSAIFRGGMKRGDFVFFSFFGSHERNEEENGRDFDGKTISRWAECR